MKPCRITNETKRVVNWFSLFTIFFSLLFASCSKESDEPKGGNRGKQIRFEASIIPQSRAATDTDFKTTWEDGDKIGLFAIRNASGGGTSSNYLHNVALTYNKQTNTWDSDTPVYFPVGGDRLDFYAYYPYDAAVTNPTNITFNISTDQSATTNGQPNYNRSDVMLSNNTKNVGSATTSVSLVFLHALAMVELKIHESHVAQGELTATLQGCVTAASGNLSSGTVTASGTAQPVKMFRLEQLDDANYSTYRALVPAQSIAAGRSLFYIKTGNNDFYSPALSEVAALNAGKVKSYVINQSETIGRQISFEVSIVPQSRAATDADLKTKWEDGDKIGLFAVRHAPGDVGVLATSDNYLNNVALRYTKKTNTWNSDTPVYFPTEGDQLDFYAYYPYDETATNPTNIIFNISTDQSATTNGQPNYNRSDVMLSNNTKNVGSVTSPVSLIFSYALAMVELKVHESYAILDGVTATLEGCMTAAAGNLSSGTVAALGTAQPVKMLRFEQPNDANYSTSFTYRALVPAQSIAAGSNLFYIKGGNRNYRSPALSEAVALTVGKTESYTMDKRIFYAVGDLYPDDTAPIGVVFWLDNPIGVDNKSDCGKIVSLNEPPGYWEALANQEGKLPWGDNTPIDASSEDDGALNMAKVKAHNPSLFNYHVFRWCVERTQGGKKWYLPALKELEAIQAAKSTLNTKLSGLNKTLLSEDWYWTSTEVHGNYAWCIDFRNGSKTYIGKGSLGFYVRPICVF